MKKTYYCLPIAVLVTNLLVGCSPAQPTNKTDSTASAEVTWLTNYDAVLKLAQSSNKLVAIDFFATWCGPCRMMERDTLANAKVQKQLTDFVPLKVDVDRQPALAAQYGIQAMPTTIIADANGKILAKAVGYLSPADYLALLARAKTSGAVSQGAAR